MVTSVGRRLIATDQGAPVIDGGLELELVIIRGWLMCSLRGPGSYLLVTVRVLQTTRLRRMLQLFKLQVQVEDYFGNE